MARPRNRAFNEEHFPRRERRFLLKECDPDRYDEARRQSEERRPAILRAGQNIEWQIPSPPVPHPTEPDRRRS